MGFIVFVPVKRFEPARMGLILLCLNYAQQRSMPTSQYESYVVVSLVQQLLLINIIRVVLE
jgi:hypothetical protein